MKLKKSLLGAALLGSALALSTPANATLLAKLDFDSGFVTDAGVIGTFGPFIGDTASAGPWNAQGWSGSYARRDDTSFVSLSLFGLAPHTTVSAGFVLGFLESWDSRNGAPSPDELEIWIDGVMVASLTTNNASGTIEDYAGGTELHDCVQANPNGFFCDTLVDMTGAPFLTFAHSSSNLLLQFRAAGAGWQNGPDEAWGIDNILLTYDANVGGVPEPASWAMMLAGFVLAGAAMRRRALSAVSA